ncbi:hypothetical protein Bca4012_073164 [Brassica carinata]
MLGFGLTPLFCGLCIISSGHKQIKACPVVTKIFNVEPPLNFRAVDLNYKKGLSLTSFSYTAKHQTFTISPIFDERQRLRGGNGGLGDDLNGGSSTQVQSKNVMKSCSSLLKCQKIKICSVFFKKILLENGKRQVMYMLQQFGRS